MSNTSYSLRLPSSASFLSRFTCPSRALLRRSLLVIWLALALAFAYLSMMAEWRARVILTGKPMAAREFFVALDNALGTWPPSRALRDLYTAAHAVDSRRHLKTVTVVRAPGVSWHQ